MQPAAIEQAADILLSAWLNERRIDALPESCRPATKADGYAIQEQLVAQAKQDVFGWKIAASSTAGQKHIGVDGPLAGALLASRLHRNGATVPLGKTLMQVAEAEFAFRMVRDLPPRGTPYSQEEVLAAVASLYPAIELPDSRYMDFVHAGGPQLIADSACANYFVLGDAVTANWRKTDLSRHAVRGYVDAQLAQQGSGANVLGDPRIALTWIANELAAHGRCVRAGQIVTTGTTTVPLTIKVGSRVRADFGEFGVVETTLS
jgi:2-keto-4-pentenoate hydratase